VEQIAHTLLDLLGKYHSPEGLTVKTADEFIQQFERKTLTKKLSEVLEFAVGS